MKVRPHLRWRRFWVGGGWVLVGIVVYLSLSSTPPPSLLDVPWDDKLEHALAYGTLMGWFMQIFTSVKERGILAILLMGLGILMEILQGMGHVRTFDYFDMVADGVGIVLAWLALRPPLTELFLRIERFARD